MTIHWGTLIVGIIAGVAVAHILMRVSSGSGSIQQAPAGQWPN